MLSPNREQKPQAKDGIKILQNITRCPVNKEMLSVSELTAGRENTT